MCLYPRAGVYCAKVTSNIKARRGVDPMHDLYLSTEIKTSWSAVGLGDGLPC
jgi:hypothetical protein